MTDYPYKTTRKVKDEYGNDRYQGFITDKEGNERLVVDMPHPVAFDHWEGTAEEARERDRSESRPNRPLHAFAAVLLALATVGAIWAAFASRSDGFGLWWWWFVLSAVYGLGSLHCVGRFLP